VETVVNAPPKFDGCYSKNNFNELYVFPSAKATFTPCKCPCYHTLESVWTRYFQHPPISQQRNHILFCPNFIQTIRTVPLPWGCSTTRQEYTLSGPAPSSKCSVSIICCHLQLGKGPVRTRRWNFAAIAFLPILAQRAWIQQPCTCAQMH